MIEVDTSDEEWSDDDNEPLKPAKAPRKQKTPVKRPAPMSPRVTRSKSAESPTDRTPAKRRKADPALKPSPPSAKARAERLRQRDQETPRKASPPPRARKPRRAAPVFGVPDDVLAALSERIRPEEAEAEAEEMIEPTFNLRPAGAHRGPSETCWSPFQMPCDQLHALFRLAEKSWTNMRT